MHKSGLDGFGGRAARRDGFISGNCHEHLVFTKYGNISKSRYTVRKTSKQGDSLKMKESLKRGEFISLTISSKILLATGKMIALLLIWKRFYSFWYTFKNYVIRNCPSKQWNDFPILKTIWPRKVESQINKYKKPLEKVDDIICLLINFSHQVTDIEIVSTSV